MEEWNNTSGMKIPLTDYIKLKIFYPVYYSYTNVNTFSRCVMYKSCTIQIITTEQHYYQQLS